MHGQYRGVMFVRDEARIGREPAIVLRPVVSVGVNIWDVATGDSGQHATVGGRVAEGVCAATCMAAADPLHVRFVDRASVKQDRQTLAT